MSDILIQYASDKDMDAVNTLLNMDVQRPIISIGKKPRILVI